MKIAVVDSGVKKWTSAIAVDSIVAPIITSAGTIAITPTDDVHITLTGGTAFIHIQSVGAGAGIQFDRPNTSDTGSMITWETNAMAKWKAGPLGDGTDNWILYNTAQAANSIAVNSSTNVTTIASLILGAALPVGSGGTGQTSYTNGQLLIGNTTGNTLAKATLTGTSNQVNVTNGAGSITLSTPQSLDTAASIQFGRVSVGRSQSTYGIECYNASSTAFINIESGNSGSNGSMRMANPSRVWVMGVRGDLSNDFAFADSTAGAIRFMLTAGAARMRFFQTSDDGVNAFQLTGSMAITGKMATYNSIATVSNGVPSEVATVDLTGQTANIGATTLYAVPAGGGGLYRITALVVLTTAASVSSTLPNVQITYTDVHTGGTVTIDATPVLGAAGAGQTGALTGNTVGLTSTGVIAINAKLSTNIQYQTVNYASTIAGMAYAVRLKLEAL